jgi:hypothetical protein
MSFCIIFVHIIRKYKIDPHKIKYPLNHNNEDVSAATSNH